MIVGFFEKKEPTMVENLRKQIKFMVNKKNKLGQEEMVGFAVILIIVAVILLVLISFMVKKTDSVAVENYEVESFIQSTLQYTSNCENYLGFQSIQELIISCEAEENCLDEQFSCDVLNSTLKDLIMKSWNVGEESAIKGYKFKVLVGEEEKFILNGGNETINYKGGFQDFARRSKDYEVSLNIYT
jgi:hypothetical protein